jgi:hypothetical protein
MAMFNVLKDVPIFTIAAFLALIFIARGAPKETVKERAHIPDDSLVQHAIMASREDLKLIAFALMGILIMLGIIADRIR